MTAWAASLSACNRRLGGSSGGKQMQSASSAIWRFVFSSLLSLFSLFFKFIFLFQPLLELSNLDGPEQRHPEIAACAADLGVHLPRPNLCHDFRQHPLHIPGRFGGRNRFQRRFVRMPIASASLSAKLCCFLGVGMKEAQPVLVWLSLAA